MNQPIKALPPTYEPETESRDLLNHRLAEANKKIFSLHKEIRFLNKRIAMKSETIESLKRTIICLDQINKNQLDVIDMYEEQLEKKETT